MILYNEFEPFSKLVNSEFYNDFETFSKLVHENGNENGNVSTNKILGSLEILAIKNDYITQWNSTTVLTLLNDNKVYILASSCTKLLNKIIVKIIFQAMEKESPWENWNLHSIGGFLGRAIEGKKQGRGHLH